MPLESTVVLIDTNAIIEATRTSVWNALTGGLVIQSVEECVEECGRETGRSSYVPVSKKELGRLASVHRVSDEQRATYLLADGESMGMDAGERDLFAYAWSRERAGDSEWLICSPDKASIRAAVRVGWPDRLVALESLATRVGARPTLPFRDHFREQFLSRYRTEFLLD